MNGGGRRDRSGKERRSPSLPISPKLPNRRVEQVFHAARFSASLAVYASPPRRLSVPAPASRYLYSMDVYWFLLRVYSPLLGVHSLWGDALHFHAGYINQQVGMASMVQTPAAATPRVGVFFAAAVKPWLTIQMRDECESSVAAVVRMEEGTKMFSSLGEPQPARNSLKAANRG